MWNLITVSMQNNWSVRHINHSTPGTKYTLSVWRSQKLYKITVYLLLRIIHARSSHFNVASHRHVDRGDCCSILGEILGNIISWGCLLEVVLRSSSPKETGLPLPLAGDMYVRAGRNGDSNFYETEGVRRLWRGGHVRQKYEDVRGASRSRSSRPRVVLGTTRRRDKNGEKHRAPGCDQRCHTMFSRSWYGGGGGEEGVEKVRARTSRSHRDLADAGGRTRVEISDGTSHREETRGIA